MLYVGWDWASETHDVTILDRNADTVDRWTLDHDAEGIDAILARLVRHGRPEDLTVAPYNPLNHGAERRLADEKPENAAA